MRARVSFLLSGREISASVRFPPVNLSAFIISIIQTMRFKFQPRTAKFAFPHCANILSNLETSGLWLRNIADMLRVIILILALVAIAIGFACGGGNTGGGSTPTEAYKQLYAAVKSKDTESIKKNLTKKTIEFGAMAAARSNTTAGKMYENGFTGTTFSATLPAIRDERIKDNMGGVEVWSSEKNAWEDLPFMLEDGVWKLAIGELFSGSFKSPGKGRDQREQEAANLVSNSTVPPSTNANANIKTPTVTDIPLGPPPKKKSNGK